MAGLGAGHLTVTTSNVFIPEVWGAETLRATENVLVAARLVKRYDSMVTGKGDTIHLPNISNLTATVKSANTAVTLSTVTEVDTTILIDQHYHVAFFVEDMAKVQSNYDLLSEYTSKSGEAVARVLDTAILSEYINFTNSDEGAYGSDITDAVILAGIEALDLANTAMKDRSFIIYPTQKTALLKIDKFVKTDYMGMANSSTVVRDGPPTESLWGDIYGMPTYYTQQVVATAGTPTQRHNMMFHKEAIGLAVQLAPRVQSENRIDFLGNLVVTDTIYGLKTVRPTFGVEIRS